MRFHSGQSGSGKSVLLRLIADLGPGTGEVELEGRSRDHWPAPEWRRRVVYQAAEPAWWAPTAGDHFRAADAALVESLLPELDLASALLHADVARLSTGERQRLAPVRSLVPRVLLLDERQRRAFAAAEARVLGRGGVAQVVAATGMSRNTIVAGMEELDGTDNEFIAAGPLATARATRRSGGGRKSATHKDPTLVPDLLALVDSTSFGTIAARTVPSRSRRTGRVSRVVVGLRLREAC